jgi:signal transduction histidine kinase
MNLEKIEEHLVVSFFEQQPQPAFWMTPVWGPDQQIIDFEYRYCNQEFYAYTGLTPEQVMGNRLFNSPAISDHDHRKRLFKEILDVYFNGQRMQSWLYNTDLKRYYSYTRNRVEDGVLTVLQDRTEEYRMMNQLEEQKSLLDNILKHSSNGISVGEVVRDANGKIADFRTLIANDAAVMLTGLPKALYLSKTGSELDPAFTRSAYFHKCVHCMETGEPFITQYFLESARRWLEVSVSKMDENRQIYIFTDVTSVKEAQMAIEHSEAQLQAIIDRTQSGILTARPVTSESGEIIDFRFVLANRALAAYVGQQPEALVGELGSRWFAGYMSNGLFDLFCDSYINNKVNRYDYHYNADGIDAWIDLMCTRYEDVVLVTFADYTPVKQLQLQLEQKVEELRRSNKNLEEFAYAASHDLKEPIRKINFFSDRLKSRLAERQDSEETALVERMEKAAQRMGLLVDDLLDYSHVSRGIDKWEEIDLNQKVAKVLEDLELTVQDKKATIEVGSLPTIRGHRRQMQQLFQNLLSNALKYSKEDVLPVISITSREVSGSELADSLPVLDPHGRYYLIEVQDNGIGFDQEHAERIFNVFTRLHGKGEYSGAGVGLSIVRKVVENHEGHIWAQSEPGVGSTFKVLLPA